MKSLVDEIRPDGLRPADLPGIPAHPRFLRELVVVKTDEGLLVDGASQLHVLWGDVAKNVLPSLISMLDGTRTVEEISDALPGLSSQQLQESLSSLRNWGLLEEGIEGDHHSEANPETVSFLRRYSGGTAAGSSGEESLAKLRANEVVIVAGDQDRDAIEYLMSLLAGNGCQNVSHVALESFHSIQNSNGSADRTVLALGVALRGEEYELFSKLDDYCSAAGIHWLRIVADLNTKFLDIGPIFERKKNPCYRCFAQVHSSPAPVAPRQLGGIALDRAKFWMCMAATAITYLLSGVAAPRLEGIFRRYDLESWSSRTKCYAAVPGCPSCRPLPTEREENSALNEQIDTAVVFEEYVAHRPGSANPSSGSDASSLLELTKQTKRLPNCPQQKLPAALPDFNSSLLSAPEIASGGRLGLAELGSLLMMTAGLRRSRPNSATPKRWAATAGNLGSVELYVVIRRVDGLSPGYYFYQPMEHSLASFRRHSGMLPVHDFMRRTLGCQGESLPDAMIVFTAAFHRVASKYGPFAYRLINLDAGVAMSQFQMLAASLNFSSKLADRWADDLIENELALEPIAEQSTAVLLLHHAQMSGLDTASVRPEPRAEIPASSKPAAEFRELSAFDVVQKLYQESRKLESGLQLGPFTVPEKLHTIDRVNSGAIPLPVPVQPARTLGDVLKARSSARYYTNESVSLEQLSTMLSFAQRADRFDWPHESEKSQSLNFLVLAKSVSNLEPAVYEYIPGDQSLLRWCEFPSHKDTVRLYVQSEFAFAPLAIWVTGNLAAACARHGAFGHRQLLLRAGAAANRLLISALGMGLGGALVAGMVAGAARATLRLDGYLKNALLAVSVGYCSRPAAPRLS